MNKLSTLLVIIALSLSIYHSLNCVGSSEKARSISIFNSIDEVTRYAQTLPEYPSPDNDDLMNPSFGNYYKSRQPGYFARIAEFFGLQLGVWRQAEFKKLLQAVIDIRERSGLKGRFITAMDSEPDKKYIFITDLRASFHSLVRYIETLKNDGIIDEHFKIIKPDYYIVFNGNTIKGFAYGLDTLTLVLRLLYNNPEHVMCIRGFQEDKSYWAQYSFNQEVQMRVSSYNYEIIKNLIARLIDTFSLASYIVAARTQKNVEVVLIYSEGSLLREFEEKYKAKYFLDPNKRIVRIEDQATMNDVEVFVKANITGELLSKNIYLQLQGMRKVSTGNDPVTWAMISGPTPFWRIIHQFFYESFVILTTAQDIAHWTLTLYNRDIRKRTVIMPKKICNLLTGQEYGSQEIFKDQAEFILEQKKKLEQSLNFALNDLHDVEIKIPKKIKEQEVQVVAKPKAQEQGEKVLTSEKDTAAAGSDSLVFGSVMDLSRNQRGISEQSIGGVELAFHAVNKAGGIKNKKLSLMVLDDQYDPKKARECVQSLIDQYKINWLLMPLGSPTLESYLDLVKAGKLLVLFPNTGSSLFRNASLKSLVNFRASYAQECQVLARYAIEKLNAKKIVLFYQKDVESIDGALDYFKSINFTNYTEVLYSSKETNFSIQVQQISQSQADSIFFLSMPSATLELIRQMGMQNVIGKNLLGWSDLISETFQNFSRSRGLKVIISSIVPNPQKSMLPLVQQYRKAADYKGLIKDGDSLEGYINARILIEILKRISGPITNENIINEVESFKNFDLGGITLNFDPQSRSLAQAIWLDTGAVDFIEVPLHYEKKNDVPKLKQEQEKKKVDDGSIETIAIGSTMDLSKSDKVIGNLIKDVLEAFFNKINHEKILGARTVKVYVLDDEYDVRKARENVQRLINEHDIKALIVPVGSSNLQGYIDLVNAGQVDVLFAQADSPAFRRPDLKNIINFSASSFEVGYLMLKYACKASEIKKLSMFYESVTGGILDGAKKALSELKIQNASEVSFSASDVDYSVQAKMIKSENPEAIVFLSGITPALSLLRLLGADFLIGKVLIGCSTFLNVDSFKKNLHDKGLKMIIPSLVPNPTIDSLPIVKDFRSFARNNAIEEEPVSLQAYISARIFVEIVKRIEGPVTKQKIIEVAEQFKNFDLGGISLTFDPQTRRLINTIWIDAGHDQWQVESIEGITKAAA